MRNYTLRSQEVSVVLLGEFDPVRFHPEWFSHRGLINEAEAANSTIALIQPDMTKFVAGWLSVEIIPDRFYFGTTEPDCFPLIRDLSCSVLSILEHSSIRAFGINIFSDYKASSEDAWHAVGDVIAPKAIWKNTFPDTIKHHGMTSTNIRSYRDNEDGLKGYYNTSVMSGNNEFGVGFRFNDHVEIEKGTSNQAVSEIIMDEWDNALGMGVETSIKILEGVENGSYNPER